MLVVAPPGTETVTVPDGAEVLVVVPALSSTREALTGAVDDRRHDAEATAAALESRLPGARVEVGADDPALAVEDALRVFGADEVLVRRRRRDVRRDPRAGRAARQPRLGGGQPETPGRTYSDPPSLVPPPQATTITGLPFSP